jgi:hypothetical protein
MRKAVTYRILFPLLLALLFIFAVVWRDLWHALLHTAVGVAVIIGAGHATQIGILRRFPFSLAAARGSITGSIALFAGILNATAMTLGVVHYFAVRSALGFALYFAALAALVFVLRLLSQRVIQQRFAVVASYE